MPEARGQSRGAGPRIEHVEASAYRIPTDRPESDGTLAWDATTIVVAHAEAGGVTGIGYTYADASAAHVVNGPLAETVVGTDAHAVSAAWWSMLDRVRNVGRAGIAACAISAVDAALWDLKAKLLGLPLVALLGPVREGVRLYGSGGFTSYTVDELRSQLGGWAEAGFTAVKMKVGTDPASDPDRVAAARDAIGPDVELMVDANGAYDRKQALWQAERFAEHGVTWFEEPVTSDDVDGLRLVRDRSPAGMQVAAGEYGYDAFSLRRLIENGAVDCLQADATRCLGLTGFLSVAALCDAWSVPLSAHTAPALHLHLGAALRCVRHLEYFHDHVRIEEALFDGVPRPRGGELAPDLDRPGLGIELRVPPEMPGLEVVV